MTASAVLFSAIYGGYDDPKPLPAGLDIPAVMYTDCDEVARRAAEFGWLPRVERHGICTLSGDPAKTAPMLAHKWWKTHPGLVADIYSNQPSVDVALWIDGSITVREPDYGARCLQALGDADLALTPHPWRDCALAEGDYSATLARYSQTRVKAQTEFYRGFHPRHWGLLASGAIAWRVNLATRQFGHYWWEECLTWSHQDQVSLPILLRLADQNNLRGVYDLKWNRNLPWEKWWTLANHAIAP